VKAFSFFGEKRWTKKDGTVTTGYKSQCKPCRYKAEKERIIATPKAKAKYSERTAQARRKRIDAMTAEEKEQAMKRQRAWSKAWRAANPEKRKAQKLKYKDNDIAYKRKRYQEKKEELDAKCREYYQQHKEEISDRLKRYNALPEIKERKSAHRKVIRPQERERMRKKIKNLDDYYVKQVLVQGTGLKPSQLPSALVEAKKLQLKIKRMSYEKC
jgi:hypothetical protein